LTLYKSQKSGTFKPLKRGTFSPLLTRHSICQHQGKIKEPFLAEICQPAGTAVLVQGIPETGSQNRTASGTYGLSGNSP